jgi:putative endopeptidase
MRHALTCLLTAGVLIGCSPSGDESASQPEVSAPSSSATLGLGVDLANMDREVRPQDDFFHFMNGGWMESNEIPSDRSRWGSFDELREAAEQHVLDIVLEAAAVTDAEPGSNAQKVGDLYRSFMDEEAIEARGLEAIAPELAAIDAIADHDDLVAMWGDARRNGTSSPVVMFIGQDQMQSDQYIAMVNQSGLGLPDRDYYLNEDERSTELREHYAAHIARMFELAGFEDGAGAAERIVAIETRIARSHWSRVQNRDRQATYNKMTLAELAESAPGFDWAGYFSAGGVDDLQELVVRQPDYMTSFAAFHGDFPVAHWREYQRFHLLRSAAAYLPAVFVEEAFDFYGRTLSGQPENRSREKRGVGVVESVLGFMVGEMYVARHFRPEAKERMDALVANLRVAFEEAIDDLEWMTDETKEEAQAKLARFNTKIGYPDVWRDYECIEVSAGDLMGNMRRATHCEYERMLARLGSEVDREEWFMTPQTVNAYYSSTMNEIVFPAAILQPPFFNVDADDAINYGAIGGVIGHEITHGFDDQGRRSDGEGNSARLVD